MRHIPPKGRFTNRPYVVSSAPGLFIILCGLRKAMVIPLKIAVDVCHIRRGRSRTARVGKDGRAWMRHIPPKGGSRTAPTSYRLRQAIFIILCGLRKAMVIPAHTPVIPAHAGTHYWIYVMHLPVVVIPAHAGTHYQRPKPSLPTPTWVSIRPSKSAFAVSVRLVLTPDATDKLKKLTNLTPLTPKHTRAIIPIPLPPRRAKRHQQPNTDN